ncbi:MAG: hypothetical protein J0L94_07205 [Rhodothermia bacterium]|nr:hypothetical protein [Rhodothermia bacterium]
MKNALFAVAFGLMALGCSEQPASTNNNQRVPLKESVYIHAIPDNMTAAPSDQEKEMRKLEIKATPTIISNLSIESAHDKLKPLLVKAQTLHDVSSFEQRVAMMMLDQRLLRQDTLTPAELTILGFYTDLLLKWENPDASLIQPALEKLKGIWSEEKMKQAQKTAFSAASVWLKKEGKTLDEHCKECYDKPNEKQTELDKIDQIAAAARALQNS